MILTPMVELFAALERFFVETRATAHASNLYSFRVFDLHYLCYERIFSNLLHYIWRNIYRSIFQKWTILSFFTKSTSIFISIASVTKNSIFPTYYSTFGGEKGFSTKRTRHSWLLADWTIFYAGDGSLCHWTNLRRTWRPHS